MYRKENRIMTNNQIQYQRYKEEARHNIETEAQGRASLDIKRSELEETVRSHKANEAFNLGSLMEQIRHNKAGEALGYSQLQEAIRHNQVSEDIQYTDVLGRQQYQREQNAIAYDRSQWEREVRQESNRIQSSYNVQSLNLGRANLDESRRSNIARESETWRHDTATERETGRHNRRTEVTDRLNAFGNAFSKVSSSVGKLGLSILGGRAMTGGQKALPILK